MPISNVSLTEIHDLVRTRKGSALESVDAHLQQIDELNPELNAFVHVDGERARGSARQVDQRVARGEPLPPLAGVPLSIKSCIDKAKAS